jgi:hypothetical protein
MVVKPKLVVALASALMRRTMVLARERGRLLVVLLILLLIGALPTWPYSASWGYAPGGLLGAVLVIVLVLALLGRI